MEKETKSIKKFYFQPFKWGFVNSGGEKVKHMRAIHSILVSSTVNRRTKRCRGNVKAQSGMTYLDPWGLWTSCVVPPGCGWRAVTTSLREQQRCDHTMSCITLSCVLPQLCPGYSRELTFAHNQCANAPWILVMRFDSQHMPKPSQPPFALLLFPLLTEGWITPARAMGSASVCCVGTLMSISLLLWSSMLSHPDVQWLGDTAFWMSQSCFEVKSTILGSCLEGRKAWGRLLWNQTFPW